MVMTEWEEISWIKWDLYNMFTETVERIIKLIQNLDQLAGAVEYTNYIYAEGWFSPSHDCSGYDTKQSVGYASVMLEL